MSSSTRFVSMLEAQITESDTSMYEVGEQRERNMRYVTLEPLGNEVRGRSHYIDPSVLDAVESKKAFFSSVFLSSRNPLKFSTVSGNADEAAAKTAYVTNILRKNKYERLFKDAWHDAFVAKRCVFLVERKEKTSTVELNLPPMQAAQANQLIDAEGDVVSVDTSQIQTQQMMGPNGQPHIMVQGRIGVEIDESYTNIHLAQPERYYRDPQATYPDEAMWNTIEDDIARGTLIDEGYDVEQVAGLATDYRFRSEEEDSARKRHDSSWTRRRQFTRVDSQETVTFYKTWTWMMPDEVEEADLDLDFELGDEQALYEIHWAHGEVMRWAEDEEGNSYHAVSIADECAFFEWTEMKISHSESGQCTSDVVAHTQKTQSTLKRQVIDNNHIVNSTNYEAVEGAIMNPRDLLSGAISKVVWSKRIGSVAPLAQPPLSPMTMPLIGMLKQDGEERSGMSSLAKGMNTDALRYQNSSDMVERLTNAGNARPAMQARDFARTFLVPVYQYIARLGQRYDTTKDVMESGGRQIPIIPSQWNDDEMEMETSVALTPEEAQELAQRMLMMDSKLTMEKQTDPQIALMYGAQQKHALLDTVWELMGVKDATPYLVPPDSPEYQQAMQRQQQQQQAAQQKAQQDEQFQKGLIQSKDQREWDKTNWDKTNDMQDNMREDEKLDWQKYIEQGELELERKQGRGVAVG